MASKLMKAGKDYFGLPILVSALLQLCVIGVILGIVTRIKEKHYLAAIIRIPAAPVMWIVDLVLILLNGEILRVL